MKAYVKPVFEYVELRAEERLAGSCTVPQWVIDLGYTTGSCVGICN